MTSLVFVRDVPILGFTSRDIATDEASVVASTTRARLVSSSWISALLAGDHANDVILYVTPASAASVQTAAVYATAQAQAIVKLAAQAGTTVSAFFDQISSNLIAQGLVFPSAVTTPPSSTTYTQAQLDAVVAPLQAQIAALQAQLAAGGSGGTPPPANSNTLHSTFAAFGLLGAATN